MTKEQRFYQQFKSNLPVNSDCVRIENALQSGMPDVNVCLRGQDVWVELKCYEGGRVLIRPAQNAWGHRRTAAGGRVVILAHHPIGNIHAWVFPDVEVISHGKYLQVTGTHLHDVVAWPDLHKLLFPKIII